MMVDPATDNLVIIDLGAARRRGQAGSTCVPPTALQPRELQHSLLLPSFLQPPSEEAEQAAARNITMERDPDVNAAITSLHGLVTRSPTDYSWEAESNLWSGEAIDTITEAPWAAHPDVRLDSPAEAYHTALTDWLNRRRADSRYRHGPPMPLDFPRHMAIPRGDTVPMRDYQPQTTTNGDKDPVAQVVVSGFDFLRRDTIRTDRAVIDWTRPLASAIDPARTLLATGQYADEGKGGKE